MTVFLTDLCRRRFGRDFPASALIGVSQLAGPGMLIEIQAIAAVP